MRKQASVDWTVGKLLNIILLVLVLVLVIYGISTQSLNPLIENIGGKFDEVLILFNLKDDIYSKDCYSESVANLGGGKDFLEEIGMGNDVVLNVCKNRMCNISEGGKETYRVKDGEFEKLENGKWVKYSAVFIGELSSIKFNWELYNAGIGVLSEAKDLYDDGFTKRFVLYGDGSGRNKDISAVWQNGEWMIIEVADIPEGEGWVKEENRWVRVNMLGFKRIEDIKNHYDKGVDNEAIDIFAKVVWKSSDIDDKVYWKETTPTRPDGEYPSSSNRGETIDKLVGDLGFGGSSDELDDDDEVKNLKSEFAKRKVGYLEEAKISAEEVASVIKENKVTINGKEFTISIEDDGNFPIVVFTSGNEIFGLKHSAYAKINSNLLKGVKLKYFPAILVKKVGSEWEEIGNEEYYRLPKDNFEEVKKATLISEFLKSKCK